jgi:hypothetical protein
MWDDSTVSGQVGKWVVVEQGVCDVWMPDLWGDNFVSSPVRAPRVYIPKILHYMKLRRYIYIY